MAHRRLPLHDVQAPPSPAELAFASAEPFQPLQLTQRVVAIADTGPGELSLRFVERLLPQLGGRADVRVLVAAYGVEPSLGQAQRARLAGATGICTMALGAAGAEQVPSAIAAASHATWLFVGLPALLAYRAPLSVLLAAGAPVLRWPAPLRALRGHVSLEISGDGLALAGPLGERLAALLAK